MATKKLTMRAVVFDFLERAGWSAGQMFFATLLAGGAEISAGNLPWKYSGTLAIGAAVASVILTALQYLTKMTELTFWPDIVVRLAKTFLSSLAASIVAVGVFNVGTFDWGTALNLALLTTLGSLGKGLLARQPGKAANPSTLPPETYAAAVSSPTPAPPG